MPNDFVIQALWDFNEFNTGVNTVIKRLGQLEARIKAMGSGSRNIGLTPEQLKKATVEMEAMGFALSNAKLTSRGIMTEWKPLEQVLLKNKQAMNQFNKETLFAASNLKQVASRVLLWTAASMAVFGLVAQLKNAVVFTMDLQDAMVELKKVLPKGSDLQMFEAKTFEMGELFGFSPLEVAKHFRTFAQAGLNANEVLEATKSSLLAVNTTGASTEDAINGMISAIKNFNLSWSESGNIVDKVMRLQADYVVDAKDLILSIQKIGPAVKAVGGNIDDLMGMVTAVVEVTRSTGTEAANALKFAFTRLGSADTQKVLARFSIFVYQTPTQLRPLRAILGDVAAKWKDLGTAQKLQLVVALAGARQYPRVAALLDNWKGALEAIKKSQLAWGDALDANAIQMETARKKWASAKVEIQALGQSLIAGGTLDALIYMTKLLASVAGGVSSLGKEVNSALFYFAGFSLIATVVASLIKSFGTIATTVGATAKVTAVWASRLSWILGLAVLVGTAFSYWQGNLDKNRKAAEDFNLRLDDLNKKVDVLRKLKISGIVDNDIIGKVKVLNDALSKLYKPGDKGIIGLNNLKKALKEAGVEVGNLTGDFKEQQRVVAMLATVYNILTSDSLKKAQENYTLAKDKADKFTKSVMAQITSQKYSYISPKPGGGIAIGGGHGLLGTQLSDTDKLMKGLYLSSHKVFEYINSEFAKGVGTIDIEETMGIAKDDPKAIAYALLLASDAAKQLGESADNTLQDMLKLMAGPTEQALSGAVSTMYKMINNITESAASDQVDIAKKLYNQLIDELNSAQANAIKVSSSKLPTAELTSATDRFQRAFDLMKEVNDKIAREKQVEGADFGQLSEHKELLAASQEAAKEYDTAIVKLNEDISHYSTLLALNSKDLKENADKITDLGEYAKEQGKEVKDVSDSYEELNNTTLMSAEALGKLQEKVDQYRLILGQLTSLQKDILKNKAIPALKSFYEIEKENRRAVADWDIVTDSIQLQIAALQEGSRVAEEFYRIRNMVPSMGLQQQLFYLDKINKEQKDLNKNAAEKAGNVDWHILTEQNKITDAQTEQAKQTLINNYALGEQEKYYSEIINRADELRGILSSWLSDTEAWLDDLRTSGSLLQTMQRLAKPISQMFLQKQAETLMKIMIPDDAGKIFGDFVYDAHYQGGQFVHDQIVSAFELAMGVPITGAGTGVRTTTGGGIGVRGGFGTTGAMGVTATGFGLLNADKQAKKIQDDYDANLKKNKKQALEIFALTYAGTTIGGMAAKGRGKGNEGVMLGSEIGTAAGLLIPGVGPVAAAGLGALGGILGGLFGGKDLKDINEQTAEIVSNTSELVDKLSPAIFNAPANFVMPMGTGYGGSSNSGGIHFYINSTDPKGAANEVGKVMEDVFGNNQRRTGSRSRTIR